MAKLKMYPIMTAAEAFQLIKENPQLIIWQYRHHRIEKVTPPLMLEM